MLVAFGKYHTLAVSAGVCPWMLSPDIYLHMLINNNYGHAAGSESALAPQDLHNPVEVFQRFVFDDNPSAALVVGNLHANAECSLHLTLGLPHIGVDLTLGF